MSSLLAAVACSLCGASEHATIYRRELELGKPLGRYPLRLQQCAACGFVYTSPRARREVLEAHYRSAFHASGGVWHEPGPGGRHARLTAERAAFVLERAAAARHGKLLDVGSGAGALLTLLASSTEWELSGLEPCAATAEASRARGLPVRAERLEDATFQPGSFDVVTCVSCLEHFWDPAEAMRALTRLVREGGRLVAEVPDSTRPKAHVAEFFSFEHLSHFTISTLERFLAVHDLETEHWERTSIDNLRVVAVKRSAGATPRIADDRQDVRRAITAYAHERARFESRLRERLAPRIEEWARQGTRVAIYGAGEHTRYLMELLPLDTLVAWILDSDPQKHGSHFLGRPVHAPEDAPRLGAGAVVVSSRPYQEEMVRRMEPVAARYGIEVLRCYSLEEARAAAAIR